MKSLFQKSISHMQSTKFLIQTMIKRYRLKIQKKEAGYLTKIYLRTIQNLLILFGALQLLWLIK